MPDDLASLWDILRAARAAARYVGETTLEEFRQESMRFRAVERELEIIGEATKRVSTEFKDAHPEFSWREMAGLRDVLAHEYDHVRVGTLWDIVHDNLPDLIAKLEPHVPEEPDDAR